MAPRALSRAWILAAALPALGASCRDATPPPTVEPERAATPQPAASAPAAPADTAPAAPPPPAAAASAGAPAPSASAPEPPPANPDELAKAAERCWGDPRCTLEEAARLYARAADAGSLRVDCYRFYHGAGLPADARRARACYERQVAAERGCDGSSPSHNRIHLAAMLIDGQGGPPEIDRARQLLAPCFADMSVQGLLEEADKRAAGAAPGKPLDFCPDIGGTTLSMTMCGHIEVLRKQAEADEAMKAIAGLLDDEAIRLARKAGRAWTAFTEKDAAHRGDVYRGGSMRPLIELGHRAGLEADRAEALRALATYAPAQDDPRAADRDLAAAYRHALAAAPDAERRQILVQAQAAWRAYRDAEVAFHRRALGPAHGAEPVARDVAARLARKRAAALREPLEP